MTLRRQGFLSLICLGALGRLSGQDVSVTDSLAMLNIPPAGAAVNASSFGHRIQSERMKSLGLRDVVAIQALIPGVVVQNNKVHYRGSRPDGIGYMLATGSTRFNITDVVNGGNAILVPVDMLEFVGVEDRSAREYAGSVTYSLVHDPHPDSYTDLPHIGIAYYADNIAAQTSSSAFDGNKRLGAYWYGYSDLSIIGRATFLDTWSVLGCANRVFQRDRDPRQYPGIALGVVGDPLTHDTITMNYPAGAVRGNTRDYVTLAGIVHGTVGSTTLDGIVLSTVGAQDDPYTGDPFVGVISNMLNVARMPRTDFHNGLAGVAVGHTLTPAIHLTLQGAYLYRASKTYDPLLGDAFLSYGDSVANAGAGAVWKRQPGDNATGRYVRPSALTIFDFSFYTPGDLVSGYERSEQNGLMIGGSMMLATGSHGLSLEAEYRTYTIRYFALNNYLLGLLPGLIASNNALPPGQRESERDLLVRYGGNNAGFDPWGTKTDGNDFYGPRRPSFFSAALTDRVQFGPTGLEVALRLDRSNTDSYTFVNPGNPQGSVKANSHEVIPSGMRKVAGYTGLSPRVKATHAFCDNFSLLVSAGTYVEQPALGSMYRGFPLGGNAATDLRPIGTAEVDVGASFRNPGKVWVEATSYFRESRDQPCVRTTYSVAGVPYQSIVSAGYSRTIGLLFGIGVQGQSRLSWNATVSVMRATGTDSEPLSNADLLQQAGIQGLSPALSPLDYDQTLRGNLQLDYRYGRNDGGPILERSGASLLATFNSGHAYTRGYEKTGDQRTPWDFQVDVALDKTIVLGGDVEVTLALQVINLFNAQNPQNVFQLTGTTSDDGMATGGLYGPPYPDLYRAINVDYYEDTWRTRLAGQRLSSLWTDEKPQLLGPPRQIRFGLRLTL